jgi:PAS domain-containing protein
MTDVLPSALGTSTASGVPGLGDVPYGTHFCHFYEGRNDLEDTLVPFFEAGLHRNEACLWVTSEPFRANEAREALGSVVPDLAERERVGQIEIIDHSDWYLHHGSTDAASTLRGWLDREERALKAGFAGLRLSGNTAWLERKDWPSFVGYERAVDEAFRPRRIVALCSYCLSRCTPTDVLDVVRNHQFAVSRRDGTWDVLEAASLRLARQDLARVRQALEIERDAKERVVALEQRHHALIETIPQLVWTADASGSVIHVNRRWVEFTGLGLDGLAHEGWLAAVHPDDRARVRSAWRDAQRDVAPIEIEARLSPNAGS